MNYKIKKITHLDGTERTDGRYPLRVGRIVSGEDSVIVIGLPAILSYMTDENGEECVGKYLRTSIVHSIDHDYTNMDIKFTTHNSIYVLEPN